MHDPIFKQIISKNRVKILLSIISLKYLNLSLKLCFYFLIKEIVFLS